MNSLERSNNYSFQVILSIILTILINFNCKAQESISFSKQRKLMVEHQINARGIKDSKVLNAMQKVERHKFVPSKYQYYSYYDNPLPIGLDQTISQPYIVALMTELLSLSGEEKVLEIGTGSGYQAAVLAEICDSVYTIEIFKELGDRARNLFDTLNYRNIKVKIGDGYKGWKNHSPFDCIIVTCAPSHIPQPLQDQLAEGGRMIIPVGKESTQYLTLLVKNEGKIEKHSIIPVRFVPMLKKDQEKY